ncbi:peptidoglycan glycosyltransferase [Novosphingobium nitrogenifigens DSM 19370]|uniref:peptidoglycan glycosyltransferase n=1 Tax=Novosphingobium nitrogenifigens DSM 19370 TaxID=983920 RepID=F1Z943_9SPHN|nr:transglycosylase domain-containing protein [Novosphingobium nitrogenifigens]EGD58937.1 peptidoglycan glycosyltransferase [Novosphingobium nitrogenifigens DSM 19370]
MADDIQPEDNSGEPSHDGSASYRIRREAAGFAGRMLRGRWLRRILVMVVVLVALYGVIWFALIRTLPDTDKLLSYQPPLPTMVRGADGEIVSSYARERRVQLRYVDFPEPLIHAFLSAEDKSFFQHHGVDITGLAGAVVDYVTKYGTGSRARGGSTITQQVAKNLLIGNEYSITRKLKEMVLAMRIESVLSKEQILELYLNEIPLGRQSFGVQAASRAYFDKDVGDLKLNEMAFLAILPKAPETYGRARNVEKALVRRNWVLDQMVKNGWATPGQAAEAKAQPLGLVVRRADSYTADAGYFLEEVRRQLIDQFGENADKGPNSVYAGGLWVRTSLDTRLQSAAQDALRAGLLRYAAGRGWHGPIATVDPAHWQEQLVGSNLSIRYLDWRVGVIVEKSGGSGTIGFADNTTGNVYGLADGVKPGDVVAVAPSGSGWVLKVIPEVSGGMVVQAPEFGRVLAMQGGFDARLGSFNRATQANRQPGSTIKPFVYATALDNGMTPTTMVLDGTFCVYQGAALGQKCFRNFGDEGASGSHTMRWGLEQSRNLMTVRIANDIGMDKVVRTIRSVGIGNYSPYLSIALGAGDTTVARMVNAYSTLADHGRLHDQTLIDFVQDRNGKVIWRADRRACDTCSMAQWDGRPMPRFKPTGRQALDSRTAYQVVHMLEGVVVRGTAASLRDLDLPLFGKTGTTSGPTNVWFVGGSPQIVAGVYLGYDQPRSLGGYAQGGRIAAPVFKQFVQATRDKWKDVPFAAPEGVRMVKIDRVSGKRVFEGTPADREPKAGIIWEAFKPDSEPRRTSRDLQISTREAVLDALRKARAARYGGAAAVEDTTGEGDVVEDGGD